MNRPKKLRFLTKYKLEGAALRTAQIVDWGTKIAQYETAYVRFLAHPEPFLSIPLLAKNIARRELRRRKALNS